MLVGAARVRRAQFAGAFVGFLRVRVRVRVRFRVRVRVPSERPQPSGREAVHVGWSPVLR